MNSSFFKYKHNVELVNNNLMTEKITVITYTFFSRLVCNIALWAK